MNLLKKSFVVIVCLIAFSFFHGIAAASMVSYPLTITTTGSLLDYWPTHQNSQGDTQYCIETPATTASGDSMGTSTYIDQFGNVNNINGRVLCQQNDTNIGVNSGSILLFTLNKLDMTNAANITTTFLNTMSSFGPGAGTNAPFGWWGKNGTNDVSSTTAATWKSEQPISVGGWVILPVFRQDPPLAFNAHDSTLIASPDGGAHWCNPNTYYNHTGAPGCDATNWDATGDAPKCGATGGNANCTDTAYLASSTRSSMIWQEPGPYQGTTGLMQSIKFFQYCNGADESSCSGMPNGADTYLYGFGCNGKRSACDLFRVAKNVTSVLDPTQYQWYSCPGYTPANVCDGTLAGSWTSPGVQTGATILWGYINTTFKSQTEPAPMNMGYPTGNINYICANTICTYVMSFQSPKTFMVTAAAPWGPYTSVPVTYPLNQGFWHILPWTVTTIDTNPFHIRAVGTWDDFVTWKNAYAATVTKAASTTLTTTIPSSWISGYPMTVVIANSSCAGLNGNKVATVVNSTTLSLTYDSTGCSGTVTGTTWTANQLEGTQFWQPEDFTFGPNNTQGSGIFGNSGVRFTMGATSNSLSRNGLKYYFDFWDNSGVPISGSTFNGTPLSTVDIVNYPPTVALTPCILNSINGGCGFYTTNAGQGWVTSGMSLNAAGGYGQGLWLMNLTSPAGQITTAGNSWAGQATSTMFVGDASWTVNMIVNVASLASQQMLFSVGTSPNDLSFRLTTGSANLQVAWNIGAGNARTVQAASPVLTTGTWVDLTVTRQGGAPITGTGVSTSTQIYVNGVAVTANNGLIGAPATNPNLASGPMYVGSYGIGGWVMTGTYATFGTWNRAMSPTEVAHMYAVQKTLMAKRGVSLP